MLLYENVDGQGTSWREQLIYQGDEHHVGAYVVDIDSDGDLTLGQDLAGPAAGAIYDARVRTAKSTALRQATRRACSMHPRCILHARRVACCC